MRLYGPTGNGTHAYSAYDVIKAIWVRAGVGTSNGDAYLESIKSDKDKMRELIRKWTPVELFLKTSRFTEFAPLESEHEWSC